MQIIIIIILIVLVVVGIYFYLKRNTKKARAERYIKKAQTTRKRINNINKHLKIADASKNLHEVRVHAREAMRLIKKYGLVNHYRDLLRSRQ